MNVPFKFYHSCILIKIKEISLFLYGNFEIKYETMVTDLRCFEKLGP